MREEFLEYQKAKQILEEHGSGPHYAGCDFRKKQWEFEKKKIDRRSDLKSGRRRIAKNWRESSGSILMFEYLTAEFRFSQLLIGNPAHYRRSGGDRPSQKTLRTKTVKQPGSRFRIFKNLLSTRTEIPPDNGFVLTGFFPFRGE